MLSRLVIDDLGFEAPEDRFDARVADVHFDEFRRRWNFLAPAAAVGPQAIEHQHIVPISDECIDQMRSDEARSAGNDDTHWGRGSAR